MLTKFKMTGFALMLSTVSACATIAESKVTPRAVQVEGVASFGREVRFQDFSVTGKGVSLKSKACINGIFQDRSKLNFDENRMEGQRVVAEGFLINYIEYASSDPFMATVSNLQNSCNNENFILISSIRLKR